MSTKSKSKRRPRWLWRVVGWLAGNRRLRKQVDWLKGENAELRDILKDRDSSLKCIREQNARLQKQAYYARESLEGRHPKLGA